MEPIELLGIRVHPVTVAELHRYLAEHIHQRRRSLVFHANVHALNLAAARPDFHAVLNRANLIFPDGAGVVLGARVLGGHIPGRITYADWLWQLAEFAAQQGFSLFLLGAKPGVAEQAAAKLVAHAPALCIAGTHHGYFDKSAASAENEAVLQAISAAHPDMLLVCFGMPDQEIWLAQNWERLNIYVGLTGGAALDYISGNLQRGPKWMTDHGFEWLARMMIEPRRLWRRYVFGNPVFLWRVARQRIVRLKHAG